MVTLSEQPDWGPGSRDIDDKTISDLEGFGESKSLGHGTSETELTSGSMPSLISLEPSFNTLSSRGLDWMMGRRRTVPPWDLKRLMKAFFLRLIRCGREDDELVY